MNYDPAFERYSYILSKLGSIAWGANGNGKARCPSHDDVHPSLSVRLGRDGELLLKCHAKNAHCTFKSIAAALDISDLRSFFPPKDAQKPLKHEIVGAFEYLSAEGEVLYRAVRTAQKDFWLERWEAETNKWIRGLNGLVQPVPYHLPDLLTASKTQWVCIAEGELKVRAFEKLGFAATCNAAGAEKWFPEWGPHFQGKHVAIFPDNDEAGYKHAGIVAACLAPYAEMVVIVELFGLRLKQDIVDWLKRWPDDSLIRRRAVLKAIEASPFYDNTDAQHRLAQLRMLMARSLVASCLI